MCDPHKSVYAVTEKGSIRAGRDRMRERGGYGERKRGIA